MVIRVNMALLCILVLLAAGVVSSNNIKLNDALINDTKLVFAFMTHRHGDRTPVKEFLHYMAKSDLERAMPLINQWGFGELTDAGKRTAFKLGQFIRRRYGRLLSPKYNASEIYIRSTDLRRTAMTVLTAMAAIYPGNTWSDNLSWDPVPYITLPIQYDHIRAIENCPILKNAFMKNAKTPNSRMDRFAELISNISNVIGVNINTRPATVFAVHNCYTSLISLGYKVKDELLALMPGMNAAADEAIDIIAGDETHLNLAAGPLLKEFFTYARKIIAGEDTPRVRVYSAHDINVYTLAAVSKVKLRQGVPKYGSLFSLELRKFVKTGHYVVLPVYLEKPGVEEIYLTVEGCDQLCDFDTFYNITSSYLLDEDAWLASCRTNRH